jgi:predicted transcriptional regulator of viral defense system
MEERKWLKSRPVVHFNEVARRAGSVGYARLLMHRLVRAGKVRQVGRGAYSASSNIFAIASNLHYPSYISFISASYLYGLTQAIPLAVYVATAKKHKETEALGYKLKFVRLGSVWGFRKERQGEEDVFVADLEKLMIDAFLKPECMGNFQEIENVFANAPKPDVGRLKGYLQRLGSERVWRQVGHMLQKHKGIDISGLMRMGRNYYAANPFARGRKMDGEWRLRI